MIPAVRAVFALIRRFRNSTEASITVEALLLLPLLLWWYIAAFQFFDAFREKAVNIKAAFTLTDMISREQVSVNAAYINGLGKLFDYLTESDERTWIRVSSIEYRQADPATAKPEEHRVLWSYGTQSKPVHTNETIMLQKSRIPIMAHLDTVIIVETYSSLRPIIDIGLNDLEFEQFVVMRPRFGLAIAWSAN